MYGNALCNEALPYMMRLMSTKTATSIQIASKIVGGKSALARLVGVKPPTVQQWANGDRPVAPRRCVAIERATNGVVTRQMLRPDDWASIWPESIEPGAPDASDDVQPPVGTSDKKEPS